MVESDNDTEGACKKLHLPQTVNSKSALTPPQRFFPIPAGAVVLDGPPGLSAASQRNAQKSNPAYRNGFFILESMENNPDYERVKFTGNMADVERELGCQGTPKFEDVCFNISIYVLKKDWGAAQASIDIWTDGSCSPAIYSTIAGGGILITDNNSNNVVALGSVGYESNRYRLSISHVEAMTGIMGPYIARKISEDFFISSVSMDARSGLRHIKDMNRSFYDSCNFEWCRGHRNNSKNDTVDSLAKIGMVEMREFCFPGYYERMENNITEWTPRRGPRPKIKRQRGVAEVLNSIESNFMFNDIVLRNDLSQAPPQRNSGLIRRYIDGYDVDATEIHILRGYRPSQSIQYGASQYENMGQDDNVGYLVVRLGECNSEKTLLSVSRYIFEGDTTLSHAANVITTVIRDEMGTLHPENELNLAWNSRGRMQYDETLEDNGTESDLEEVSPEDEMEEDVSQNTEIKGKRLPVYINTPFKIYLSDDLFGVWKQSFENGVGTSSYKEFINALSDASSESAEFGKVDITECMPIHSTLLDDNDIDHIMTLSGEDFNLVGNSIEVEPSRGNGMSVSHPDDDQPYFGPDVNPFDFMDNTDKGSDFSPYP